MIQDITRHYSGSWGNAYQRYQWEKGSMKKAFPFFDILVFPPRTERNMWTYATCGMSLAKCRLPIELHLFSLFEDDSIIELLTTIAYFHMNDVELGLHHSINFGRPWSNHSDCEYGIISLPYLDGPSLENFNCAEKDISFYWLIPITESELSYKKRYGIEALEEKFENSNFDYPNPNRKYVI